MSVEIHEWPTGSVDVYVSAALCVQVGLTLDGGRFYRVAFLRRGREVASAPLTREAAEAICGCPLPEGKR